MRIAYLVVALSALFVSGCEEMWVDSGRFREDFQYRHDVTPGMRLYVENLNGPVEITGWTQNSIEITGTKQASTESGLKALKIDVVAQPDSVRIRTIPPSGRWGGYGARYTIRLPQKAVLESIETSNGPIRVESVDGPARLRTSNGPIRLFRLSGPVEAKTSNAPIELADVRGSVLATTSNGPVRADGVYGAFEATTSNSGINATLNDPEPSRPVKLTTSNGSVELVMNQFRDNDVRIHTSNSGITLRLPPGVRSQLRAKTSNSSVQTDFDVAVRAGELRKAWVEGTIGGGGALLDLTTSNGGIKVLRN